MDCKEYLDFLHSITGLHRNKWATSAVGDRREKKRTYTAISATGWQAVDSARHPARALLPPWPGVDPGAYIDFVRLQNGVNLTKWPTAAAEYHRG